MIRIRSANIKDADTVVDMVIKLLTELTGGTRAIDKESLLNVCLEQLEKKIMYTPFLALSETNQCVGMITVAESFALHSGGRFGIIQEFYVSPEHRSSKIGQQLLTTVVEYGKKNQWRRIEVGAPNPLTWERTVSFYKREGFTEIGPRLKLILDEGNS
ncbi:GNAT family N-acetyltransferase [Aureibacillus halotolerans]|uniref:Ribosomal protein S18 acetylase RimI-like enzyme n=1 Tax=Aureibacillus halotolerans TaxID=1508390 RepID=A0A4R6U3B5_9BACI|nr:GNAT family N-acetyltransferase [Aureibacillus halotolerans]TDQ40880.1 ribosomal protein S18 acetylase RimI-like enzyme [Aureibacillus halotolerans]